MMIKNQSYLKKHKSLVSLVFAFSILIVIIFPLLSALENQNYTLQTSKESITITQIFETNNKADLEIIGADYLIITPDAFYENILPLALSKENKGLLTKIVNISDIASNPSAEIISEYIQSAYDNWNPAPTYLLLVGDVELLPAHYRNGGPATDLYYSTVVGDDYYPDIYVGRFPVKTANELDIIVDKTLNYENNFNQSDDWRQNILMAAHKQNGRYYIDTSESIRQFLVDESYTANTVYTGGSSTGTTQDVIDLINEGTFIVNHRNHGGVSGWSHPSLTIDDIPSLNNMDMLPVMFSVNCLSGYYDARTVDCFGEAILKAQDKGVVGYIGASRISYSGFNDELNKGFFSAIFPDYYPGYRNPVEHSTKLGAILNYGKHFMLDKYILTRADDYHYSWGKQYLTPSQTQYQFEVFNLFGDPELSIIEFPHDLSVDLEIPNQRLINKAYTINASVINNGVNLETDFNLVLYLNEIPVASKNILNLNIGEKETINYSWTPTEYGIYNITAYVSPVIDEFSWSNNIFTELITINPPTTPFKDDFENGLSNWYYNTSLWHITDDYSAWPDSYHSSSHALWFGQEATGNYYTGNKQMGNMISKTIDLNGAEKAYLTFDHWRETKVSNEWSNVYISTNGINWDLIYSNNSDISPWEHVNLNISSYVGNENIRIRFCFDVNDNSVSDNRGWLVDDICISIEESNPPTWVELPQDQIWEYKNAFHYELKADDFFGINNWWINNTSQFEIDSNGILTNKILLELGEYWVEIRAYDPFDNNCSRVIKIIVEEAVSPTWDQTPVDQIIQQGNSLNYNINASDLSDIDRYWINNTINFNIDGNGILTSTSQLEVGEYWLEIRAYDPLNNFCFCTLKITILQQNSPLDFIMFLNLIGAPLVVIGILVSAVKLLKKR